MGSAEPHRNPPSPGLGEWAGRSIPSAAPGKVPVGKEVAGQELAGQELAGQEPAGKELAADIGLEADGRRIPRYSGSQVRGAERSRATSPMSGESHR